MTCMLRLSLSLQLHDRVSGMNDLNNITTMGFSLYYRPLMVACMDFFQVNHGMGDKPRMITGSMEICLKAHYA